MTAHPVGPKADFEPGTARTVKFEGVEPIAVFRTEDGEFHATSDTCTHEEWSLGEDGDLEGTEVTCPLHLARFDIRTGAPLCFPASVPLTSYPVEVDADGTVSVVV
ncbi:bifunctional 3-phenylpropionate/cinnamic acid dioxygenase ferredoxin subunit [Pseudonocardia halophobica]|uniref:Bifunctional 3-phenylpropionate/cinnamic acid dioxygenase ferredoxin subunit n=1 Tax=Pseudonocardia halophobica TaxID=29401 RepID=A0A9W6UFA2_9PSEU|nr:non-heme iron oxygenase ferredoxin subunit [Pseudonocardia halophobica]GLL15531.1 bifunctional 3-phenylpropionate/cinnamic acid dioxygenase ferredoxin subunit [Pseudonocardia halophobica]